MQVDHSVCGLGSEVEGLSKIVMPEHSGRYERDISNEFQDEDLG